MSYTVNIEGKNEIRTLDELYIMLDIIIEDENYELCSMIKYIIDNYDELVKFITGKKIEGIGVFIDKQENNNV